MKYSIFYYGADYLAGLQLVSCSFYGKLNPNAYFIDGKLVNKNSPKMIIKSCRFSSSMTNALNQDGQFASIDLKDQIFESSQFEEYSQKKLNVKSIVLISVAALAVIVVLIVTILVIIKKRTNPNVYSIEYDAIEMSTNSTVVSLNTPLI